MKTSLIASVLFIASAPFAYAQQTQELAPIDASVITEEVTVQQLSAETGLSPRHVRMVLGSRTDHADYRIAAYFENGQVSVTSADKRTATSSAAPRKQQFVDTVEDALLVMAQFLADETR